MSPIERNDEISERFLAQQIDYTVDEKGLQ